MDRVKTGHPRAFLIRGCSPIAVLLASGGRAGDKGGEFNMPRGGLLPGLTVDRSLLDSCVPLGGD